MTSLGLPDGVIRIAPYDPEWPRVYAAERERLAAAVGDLIALSHAFFREYAAHHETFLQIDELRDEDVVGYFAAMLASEDAAAFVAVDGGRMVG